MATFGYVRVSTATQKESGYGLQTQRDEITKYAREHGMSIDRIFADEGVSANIKDVEDDDALNRRKGLIEMLAALTEGDTILIANTSRLWRSDVTRVIVRRELMRRKAKVISVQQPQFNMYSNDPNEFLVTQMMELLDIVDRMQVSVKLARGRATKAAQGTKPAGRLNYGYKYSSDGKRVEVNPDEAPAVKMMFSMAQCGKSLADITSALTEHGYTTRKGGTWSRTSVANILHNEFYIGMLQHDGKSIKGTHEPLVSKIQFGKVQKKLQAHHK